MPETKEEAPQETAAEKSKPSGDLKKKRTRVTIGVVVAVLVVAGIGGFVWHEQPGFCNAICHTPMDGYLETYEAQAGQQATDKWGNTVANASGMLASVHKNNDSKATCMSCHKPVLSEQLSEAGSWITGDYTLVATESKPSGTLAERDSEQLTEARGVDGKEFCLNESCHNMTLEDLTKKTQVESDDPAVQIRNPHSWEHGTQQCTDCHKAHRASVLTCSECHADMELPEGWISVQEERALANQG